MCEEMEERIFLYVVKSVISMLIIMLPKFATSMFCVSQHSIYQNRSIFNTLFIFCLFTIDNKMFCGCSISSILVVKN